MKGEKENDQEHQEELYDEINSLYDMENPRGGDDHEEIKS